MLLYKWLKGQYVVLEMKYKLHNWINKLFSEENKIPILKLERWQGPPHVNTVNQYKAVLSLKSQFVCSVMKTKRIYLFSIDDKNFLF